MDFPFEITVTNSKIIIGGCCCYPCKSTNYGKISPREHIIGLGDISPLFGVIRRNSPHSFIPVASVDSTTPIYVSETALSCCTVFDGSMKQPLWFVLTNGPSFYLLVRVQISRGIRGTFYPINSLDDIPTTELSEMPHSFVTLRKYEKNRLMFSDFHVRLFGDSPILFVDTSRPSSTEQSSPITSLSSPVRFTSCIDPKFIP
jgi:hypothetical protein